MEATPDDHWHPEPYKDKYDKIRQKLERTETIAVELHAAWDEFNKTQRVGRPGKGPDRDNLVTLTKVLASQLSFLQQLYDSDTLERTNDYLIVLAARQELTYSIDRLGMV